MLGKVIFENGGVNMETILTGEGWQCDADPITANVLDVLFPASAFESPAYGPFGVGAVNAAAHYLNGQPVFEPDDEDDPEPEPTDY